MRLSFLEPLYARPGPYASVCLDTSRDIDDPERAIELRWRHLRDDLVEQGADDGTVQALADAVGTDRDVPGRHGQALFAAHGQVLLSEELPEPPAQDLARFAPLPEAMPLALQHAPDITYAAVVIHRIDRRDSGADHDELDVDLQIGQWPLSKVRPGARVHRHFRFASDAWQEGAARVVDDLVDPTRQDAVEAVVVCGEVWARGVLINRMPVALRERVETLEEDGGRTRETDRALLEEELNGLFQGRMNDQDAALTETFLAQRAARGGSEVEGKAAAIEALQRAQVRALLINPAADLSEPVWVGAEPAQIALAAADLRHFGVGAVAEQTASAALLRALVGTGAQLVVVPDERLTMDGRLGVLLRYTERHAAP
ncbi:hypothetical protein [Streptomyces gobiensis]|uniref:baeRF2 domain-containing protein n=1 Tax=Streptomyces gobiensis TaxID=2875706 RepID=UPI001E5C2C68|nr:hypothetical protein [Streptomyces gobiensis]UGY90530.1 hypothetical protein test1122_01505 [Streptomyces gobiensis]